MYNMYMSEFSYFEASVGAVIDQLEANGVDRLYTREKRFLRSDKMVPVVDNLPVEVTQYAFRRGETLNAVYREVVNTYKWRQAARALKEFLRGESDEPHAEIPPSPKPNRYCIKAIAWVDATPPNLLSEMPTYDDLEEAERNGIATYLSYVHNWWDDYQAELEHSQWLEEQRQKQAEEKRRLAQEKYAKHRARSKNMSRSL